MALFMQSLDATILNTALPAISTSLNESPLEMQMTIISYSLTVALFIPLTGWIADKYGTLNVCLDLVADFAGHGRRVDDACRTFNDHSECP